MSANNANEKRSLSISELRARLAEGDANRVWRGLEEIAETEEFREFVEREFPRTAPPWAAAIDRRKFLKVAAAAMALAGLAGCRKQPIEKIFPYVRMPEGLVPGVPDYYASTVTLGGYAHGVLVESHTGRPTFLAGNPEHPASLGATDPWVSAAILDLYDPNRSQTVIFEGIIKTYEAFLNAAREEMNRQKATGGSGLRILTETVTSPTLAAEIQRLLAEYPGAKWYQWEPVNHDNATRAAQAVFGKAVDCVYEFEKADVVVSLDGDFMGDGPGRIRYTRRFTDRRRVRKDTKEINRLYSAESTPTITGGMADNRVRVSPSNVEEVAKALASAIGMPMQARELDAKVAKWVTAAAADLAAHRGRCIVYPGRNASPATHAIAHLLNEALGNVGITVKRVSPIAAKPTVQIDDLRALHSELKAGSVNALMIIGATPVYNAPADLPFAELLKNVPFTVRLGTYADETSLYCRWHVPMAHELETWGDARAFDGTVSLMQPLIEPLLGGKSPLEVLSAIRGDEKAADELVMRHWQSATGLSGEAFNAQWRKWLHDGVIPNSFAQEEAVVADLGGVSRLAMAAGSGMEVAFRHDPTIFDGRFSNNAWLQELPKPLYKTTWDNVIAMSPATAEQLGIEPAKEGRNGKGAVVDVVAVKYQGRSIEGPALVLPGHADNCVTLTFGYGRKLDTLRDAGNTPGYSAFAIQTSESPSFGVGVVVERTGAKTEVAQVQFHHAMEVPGMEGRALVRPTTIDDFVAHPDYVHHVGQHHGPPVSLYPDREYNGNKWGMVVDTSVCTGCSACVTACQNENNIPPVGRDEVTRGREMHWIRIDRYYSGNDLDNPETHHLPVMCQHCELAPCEVVCPVAATTHDHEGLNVMTYNRCVGTRYCSNNCPYKVRRFNYFEYSERNVTPIHKLLMNPDVTVRSRGVMEKCSYCVQRINEARKRAKKENRPIRDGEVQTACQAACPAKAIYFGNLNDPEAEITGLAAEPHNYSLLEEINTRPRTTYLGKVKNPNPELGGQAKADH
jgi:molybdopterin-containing oxidoreductase family iron-sulfur binding subunit